MKRPAFQFYPGDWRNNAKLRRCSDAARGAWMDIMCVLHDSDEYGVVRWPLVDLARAAGVPIKLAREVAEKGVLKGADRNALPYVFQPRHAGQLGEPVTLVEAGDGPCWYCSRFVRDEYVRSRRGAGTRFGTEGQPKQAPKASPNQPPMPPFGERQGYGASSSSSSSSSVVTASQGEDSLPGEGADVRAHEAATTTGLACRAMREAGIPVTNPSHIDLRALVDAGVPLDVFRDTAAECVARGKHDMPYVLGVIRGRLKDAAQRAEAQQALTQQHGTANTSQAPPAPSTSKTVAGMQALEEMIDDYPDENSEVVRGSDHSRAAAAAEHVARRTPPAGNGQADRGVVDRRDVAGAELVGR